MKRTIQIVITAEIDTDAMRELRTIREHPEKAEASAIVPMLEKLWIHKTYGWPLRRDWVRPERVEIREVS